MATENPQLRLVAPLKPAAYVPIGNGGRKPGSSSMNNTKSHNQTTGTMVQALVPGVAVPSSNTKPPVYLSAEAQEVWAKLVPELEKSGLFTVLDYEALGMCLSAWTIARCALIDIFDRKGGISMVGPNGTFLRNPAVSTFTTASMLFANLAKEFGMTPAARAKLNSFIQDGAKSEFEKLLD